MTKSFQGWSEFYLRNCFILSQYQSNKCPSCSRCHFCVVLPNIVLTFRFVFCRPQHPQSGWKREEMIEHHAVCFCSVAWFTEPLCFSSHLWHWGQWSIQPDRGRSLHWWCTRPCLSAPRGGLTGSKLHRCWRCNSWCWYLSWCDFGTMWCEVWGPLSLHSSCNIHSLWALSGASAAQWSLEHTADRTPFWLVHSLQTFLQDRRYGENESFLAHRLVSVVVNGAQTNLFSFPPPRLVTPKVQIRPCHFWRRHGSYIPFPAWCCRRWTCYWRACQPLWSMCVWWSPVWKLCSAGGRHASRQVKAPTWQSLCRARFPPVLWVQEASDHL